MILLFRVLALGFTGFRDRWVRVLALGLQWLHKGSRQG